MTHPLQNEFSKPDQMSVVRVMRRNIEMNRKMYEKCIKMSECRAFLIAVLKNLDWTLTFTEIVDFAKVANGF